MFVVVVVFFFCLSLSLAQGKRVDIPSQWFPFMKEKRLGRASYGMANGKFLPVLGPAEFLPGSIPLLDVG